MNQVIFSAVLAVSLGISLGFPVQTCEKLKEVTGGIDHHDRYLIKLKNSSNYMDAEYIINLVDGYQTMLEQHASNVNEPSVISKLELTGNPGMLHGILSQQALILVCSESRVELILPDHTRSHIDPPVDDKDVYPADCFKLVGNESHHNNNYSVTLKRKASANTVYHITTKMELAKLSDDTLSFKYYYSIRKNHQITMAVEMNIKALQMICKERKVKEIRPNDISTISKKSIESVSDQDLATTNTTLNDHCGLPEYDEEFPTFIFVYSKAANLDEIIKLVKGYNSNPAGVILAAPIEELKMIIFQMNRAAYLQACKDPSVTLVEYAKPVTLNTPETAIPSSQTSEPLSTKAAANSNICQHIDLLQDKIVTYIMLLKGSQAIEAKREQCLKLIKNFKHQASKSSNIFYFVAYPEQSCQTNAPDIKLKAKLNLKALKYACTMKELQISATL